MATGLLDQWGESDGEGLHARAWQDRTGRIIAHNMLAAMKNNKLSKTIVVNVVETAAAHWDAREVSKYFTTVGCRASRAVFDVIVANAPDWRFKGRAATELDCHFEQFVTLRRLMDGDVIPLDSAALRAKGFRSQPGARPCSGRRWPASPTAVR